MRSTSECSTVEGQALKAKMETLICMAGPTSAPVSLHAPHMYSYEYTCRPLFFMTGS